MRDRDLRRSNLALGWSQAKRQERPRPRPRRTMRAHARAHTHNRVGGRSRVIFCLARATRVEIRSEYAARRAEDCPAARAAPARHTHSDLCVGGTVL